MSARTGLVRISFWTACAFVQQVAGALIGEVEQVLHAHDLGLVEGATEVVDGGVAEADAVDEPVGVGLDERPELRVEALGGRRPVHEAQVHRGEPIDAEGGEVVLDAGAQLVRLVVPQHRAVVIAACSDLAHDGEITRVRKQGLTDQLVDDTRSVVLGGVDVIDPAVDCGSQHP